MGPENDPIEEVLDAIVDGGRVAWRDLEESGRIEAGELASLRSLAGVRDLHRDLIQEAAESARKIETGYELIEHLGSGCDGQVWRARDRALERECALKVLDRPDVSPAERQRFLREARALARLDHENVVRVFAVEEVEGRVSIALELVEGRTLQARIADEGPLSAGQTAELGLSLCAALVAMHAEGLVHRDVKPANVMLTPEGRVVLLDFGLVRGVKNGGDEPLSGDSGPLSSGVGGAGGTPLFMPPEAWDRGVPDGPATDVYALGVTLFWAASRRYPHTADDLVALEASLRAGAPPSLASVRPDLPAAFVRVVDRALAPVSERFASASEMAAELRAFLAESRRRVRRRRALWACVAVAALVGAAFLPSVLEELRFTSEVELRALRGGQRVPLFEGSLVELGDGLELAVEVDREAWLYVFNEDRHGLLTTLFPMPERGLGNPLAPGASLVPGDCLGSVPTDAICWEVTTPGGGYEDFLVIVSPEPSSAGEALVEALPSAVDAPRTYAALPSGVRDTVLRGVGAVERPPTSTHRPAPEGSQTLRRRFWERGDEGAGAERWEMIRVRTRE